MLVMYLASIIRATVALHNLINNKVEFTPTLYALALSCVIHCTGAWIRLRTWKPRKAASSPPDSKKKVGLRLMTAKGHTPQKR